MRKVLFAIALGTLLVTPVITLAQEQAPTLIQTGEDLQALIATIGNWLFTILLAVAAVFLIYAGFLWITAGGNPENATKARTMLINALIGVAIALLARGMVEVIKSVLGA